MAEKKTHFGRAAGYFAMSELLLRGWNVAVPVVDIGDDVFVIDDADKSTWRLQIKSTDARLQGDGAVTLTGLSRAQLRAAKPIELLFMFLVRQPTAWRFLIIPRTRLVQIRDEYVEAWKCGGRRGRPPVGDEDAKGDALSIVLTLTATTARGWDADLTPHLDTWPAELPVLRGGPGSVRAGSADGVPDPDDADVDGATTPGGSPAPSRDRGT